MLKIAIDFDSTLFPSMERVLEVYNKRHNTFLDMSQITMYNLHDVFPADVADELIELFVDKETYSSLQPYKGSTRAIKTLTERGNEIYIATSTDVRNMEWKEELLQKYFPFIPKKNLIRIHNKSLLNVDVLIEDKLSNLKNTFAERVCFDQLWNRDDSVDYAYGIYRFNNWSDLSQIINDIERKLK